MKQSVATNAPRTSGRRLWQVGCLIAITFSVSGCSHSPTFNILGSYFPGWLACMMLGVLAAVLVHMAFHRRGWEGRLAALPLFYLSVTLAVACVCWLLAFE